MWEFSPIKRDSDEIRTFEHSILKETETSMTVEINFLTPDYIFTFWVVADEDGDDDFTTTVVRMEMIKHEMTPQQIRDF